ncbi:hypothetical protein SPBR_03732 [Sporothrix brasiliensis 5110]|uniref:Protein kinase domain-containing protein n=1 Tax=Sporothrix brasiliensis 5110 TaxID=1398154 RepID=A0A0C2J0J6_9PEZI|nr:uncharacterized protein SPBR_03732 [Sporothrix brasiliensis 5110]KIH94906.1 hypothetical protein SPBR_03732 [Sporothrix brasiliensis 5110]
MPPIFPIYPDWPESAADLVPLPLCPGPKLAPFDFEGPQKIEFLNYLGGGLHSHVLKVRIKGQDYALKLFRFPFELDWLGPGEDERYNRTRNKMSAFAAYSDPFNSECRAFGRLKETGHEDLAIPCYGYVLLDEAHERKLQDKFELVLNGNCEWQTDHDMRGLYPCERSGKPPPIRCIVKKLAKLECGIEGHTMGVSKKGQALYLGSGRVNPKIGNFSVPAARKILRTLIHLHQLGIFHVDVRREQFLDGHFCDFSTAVTIPHFLTNPELNPRLNAEEMALMEHETFVYAMCDYWAFETMLCEDMCKEPRQTSRLKELVTVFPRWARYEEGYPLRVYNLRRTAVREQQRQRVYALVDPRKFDWKALAEVEPGMEARQRRKVTLPLRPERWYFDCTPEEAAELNERNPAYCTLEWFATEEGFIYPQHRFRGIRADKKVKELEEREEKARAEAEAGEACI